MIIQPNSKLLMIGDSITDCGRARPVGDTSAFAWDRVHSNQAGHMALARAFLQSVGYEWE